MKKIFLHIQPWAPLLCVVFAVLLSEDLLARAGGGGGGGGGHGGGGGGDSGLLIILFYLLRAIWSVGFPFNLIIIAGLAVAAYFLFKANKRKTGLNALGDQLKNRQPDQNVGEVFLQYEINPEELRTKARTAFMEIQQAWMNQNLKNVRRYISDGVYQRFHFQFEMMRLLDQKNKLENIQLHAARIIRIEEDADMLVAHIQLSASMKDSYYSEKYSGIKQSFTEDFTEYWTFIRKKNYKKADLYRTETCPNCGTPLPNDGAETSKCPSCGTLTNSGEYDWVLSEITQADAFIEGESSSSKTGSWRGKLQIPQRISMQELEDKTSNAFIRMYAAITARKPEMARRFTADPVFAKIQERSQNEIPYVFFRFYLNSVSTLSFYQREGYDYTAMCINLTSQKVRIEGDKLKWVDMAPTSRKEVLVLKRKIAAELPKGKLYEHACPNCGAPVGDTIDTACQYCSAELNSGEHEWIVDGWMTLGEWKAEGAKTGVDSALQVRDYALNNLMVILAADGIISEEERAYLKRIEKKWDFNPEKVESYLQLAMQKKLSLKFPEDVHQRNQIKAMMYEAAMADQSISPEEKEILDSLE